MSLARIFLLGSVLFCCFFGANAFAQVNDESESGKNDTNSPFYYHEPWDFGEDYPKRYLNKEAFQYEEIGKEENWLDRLKNRIDRVWRRFWEGIIGERILDSFLVILSQVAPYLLIVGLMVFLIWLVIKSSGRVQEDELFGTSPYHQDEELLRNRDLILLVEEAIRQQDYRLALRYRYLLILQQLIRKKLIDWKSFKTNSDYVREIQDRGLQHFLAEATNIYNLIWYGQFELDADSFQLFEKNLIWKEGNNV